MVLVVEREQPDVGNRDYICPPSIRADGGVERLHCLPWDAATGLRWAELLADLRASGLAMPIKDSLIVATALVHRLVVATPNRTDFENAGVDVLDPFEEPSAPSRRI